VQKVLDVCQAAELDAEKKAYAEACNSSRAALLASDRKWLQTALDAFARNDWAKTIRSASFVSSYDSDLYNKAADLVKQAKAAQQKGATP
jgi:hypothetical protein